MLWIWLRIKDWDITASYSLSRRRQEGGVQSSTFPATTRMLPLPTRGLRITLNGSLPVQGSLRWPFHSSSDLHKGIFSLCGSGLTEGGIHLLQYLDNWLVIADVVLSAGTCEFLLHLCRDLGIVNIWEKSDLELMNRAQYFRMLLGTI